MNEGYFGQSHSKIFEMTNLYSQQTSHYTNLFILPHFINCNSNLQVIFSLEHRLRCVLAPSGANVIKLFTAVFTTTLHKKLEHLSLASLSRLV
jgi:hypothetical protein